MYTQQRPMSGLASLMALQGRGGDTTLVHMNPMEVRRLAALSPDGTLSVNPETGLPEAFKLKDALGVALPLAASFIFPAIAPAALTSALGATGTAALGAGIGGTLGGLAQGQGLGNSLIRGGISGLLSYGIGSALAPAGPAGSAMTATGPTSLPSNLAAAPDVMAVGPDVIASEAAQPSFFEGLRQSAAKPLGTVLGQPITGAGIATGLGTAALEPVVSEGLGLTQPEYAPFEIAYDEYRPDMAGLTAAGRARARRLQQPPSYASSADLARLAAGPSGYGSFIAADGGSVPTPFRFADGGMTPPVKPYGDPYNTGDSISAYGTPSPTATGPAVQTGLGGLTTPIANFGLGAFNPTPLGLGLTALSMVPGPVGVLGSLAGLANIASNLIGPTQTNPVTGQQQMFGVGNQAFDMYGNERGSEQAMDAATGNMMASMGPGVTFEGFMDEASGYGGDQGGFDVGSGGMGPGGEGEADSDNYAQGGGISALAYGGDTAPAGYANKAFEGMVPGQGSGMSDSVPFSIEGQQPALLSRDEYVLPADVVSQLGDGSSGAGADLLNNFVSQVRQSKYGNTQQPPANGAGLMGSLMRRGGIV